MAGRDQLIVRRRRLGTAAALVLGLAAVAGIFAAVHSRGQPAPPPPLPPPKPFRIVFPEGFTRAEMAVRVKKVAKIAVRERGKPVRLNATGYLAEIGRAHV